MVDGAVNPLIGRSSATKGGATVKDDCIYLLGAGFSKHCGLPLASELTEQVIRHVASENDPTLARFMEPTLDGWKGFLRQLCPQCDFSSTWPDFEDLVTTLDEWEQYRAESTGTPTPGGPEQPAHLKRVLLKGLALVLCEQTPAQSDDRLEAVKRFVRTAAEQGHQIISFNWDLVLEAAALDLGLSISYGGKVEDGLQVAKPHGSLNLAEIQQSGYEKLKADNPVNIFNISLEFEENDSVVVRADDVVKNYKKYVRTDIEKKQATWTEWFAETATSP
jgi:hypothetical protein